MDFHRLRIWIYSKISLHCSMINIPSLVQLLNLAFFFIAVNCQKECCANIGPDIEITLFFKNVHCYLRLLKLKGTRTPTTARKRFCLVFFGVFTLYIFIWELENVLPANKGGKHVLLIVSTILYCSNLCRRNHMYPHYGENLSLPSKLLHKERWPCD